jgi:carbon-monoxide dehydrogenase medium subunit
MIPAAFDYARPKSLEEAFELLGKHGPDAKLLAGGHSLLPMMKLRMATPSLLVDISRVPGLGQIAASGERTSIGALVTHAAIADSEAIRQSAPVLHDAASAIGDAQVRNRGTIGGACAHADPAADYPAALLALDAAFTIRTRTGTRTVAAADFFRGMFETALEPDAVLTEIGFGAAPHSAYVKFPHPASHYAVVGVAVKLELQGSTISAARVAIAGVGDSAFRAASVERALVGEGARDNDAIRSACVDAAAGVEARSDVFASGAYRAAMAKVYAARAVTAAASR